MPSILVTDAGRGSAVSVIRSLGRRGFGVVAADVHRRSAGFYSRFTSERLVYPDPRLYPKAAIDTLLAAAEAYGVALIVPVTDDIVLPLGAARARFEGVCQLALADPAAQHVASDKLATLQLARAVGVPVPRTAVVSTVAEARAEAPRIGWPIVLKPQASRVYSEGLGIAAYGVAYAADLKDLTRRMEALEGRCTVLLQELNAGQGHGVELLMHRGRPLVAFQHRRLREVPITGGASSFRESVPLDLELYDYAVRLLAALEWTGLAMVEFKVGPERATLMEINGRIWGSLALAVKSGVDFPSRLAELYLEGPPPEGTQVDTRYRTGVRSRNLELEMSWIGSALRRYRHYPFLANPSRAEGLAVALRLLDPGDGYDVLSREDPRPGLAELAKIAFKIPRKLLVVEAGDARCSRQTGRI